MQPVNLRPRGKICIRSDNFPRGVVVTRLAVCGGVIHVEQIAAAGILEEKERPSTSQPGRMKRFKALTEAGLRYGINKPGMDEIETQPHYYENSFEALVARYLRVE